MRSEAMSRSCRKSPTPFLPPAAVAACLALAVLPLGAEETVDYFKKNCFNCHTIGGGRLVGPDLKDVTQRRDAGWLTRFLNNPKDLIDSGDPIAQQLFQEARGVVMPVAPELDASRIASLLKLIEEESKLPKSQFVSAGSLIPDRPFTAEEVSRGRDLFMGSAPLSGGGPACVSCHSLQGVGGLGGGRLGPDLTSVFARLQGRKGLSSWLSSPPSPTMQPIYKAHPLDAGEPKQAGALNEVIHLVAYLEKTSQASPEADSRVDRITFFLLGLFGAASCLVVFDFFWRRRFREVRGLLVRGENE